MELIVLARAEMEVMETQMRLEDAIPGLGERFSERVEEELDRLIAFPEAGSLYWPPFRKLLVRDFPFGIFYSVEGRRVIVQTVLDLRRDPQAIRRRLSLD